MSFLFLIFYIATFITDGQAEDKITSVLYPFRFPEPTGSQTVDFKTQGDINLAKQQIPCDNCFWPDANFLERDVNSLYQKRSSAIDEEIYKLETGRCQHDRLSFNWTLSWSTPQIYTTELSCSAEHLCLVQATWLGNFKWELEVRHVDKKYLNSQSTSIWGYVLNKQNQHVVTHSFTSSSQRRLWFRYIEWHDEGSIHLQEKWRCRADRLVYPFSHTVSLNCFQNPKASGWPSIMFGFKEPDSS